MDDFDKNNALTVLGIETTCDETAASVVSLDKNGICNASTIYQKQNKIEIFDKAFNDLCSLVMRQTDYNEEQAKQKLIEYDNNYLEVIKNYINPSKINNNNNNTKKTTNH